jgi:hypothetical protein
MLAGGGRTSKLLQSPLHVRCTPWPLFQSFQNQQELTGETLGMADQLTPLGVEFSRQEMERIFSSVNPGVQVREWGMGRIYNPHGVTTYFDRVFNLMAKPCRKLKGIKKDKNPREPGRYYDEDNAHLRTRLPETNELVHPSVRIRYLYGGPGLDGKGVWSCGALIGEGCYSLLSDPNSIHPRQGRQLNQSKSEYQCVVGVAIPYYGKPPEPNKRPSDKDKDRRLVRVEQPNWFKSFENAINNLLPPPERRWFWSPEFDGGEILEEEHLGIWEQKFIHINDKLKERAVVDGVGTGAGSGDGASRYTLRGGSGLPEGCSEYRLLDVNRWENWTPA